MALSANRRLTSLTKVSKTTMRLVPSAMSTHVAQLMMPARNDCSLHLQKQKKFICVDRDPEFIPGTQSNTNGALMLFGTI